MIVPVCQGINCLALMWAGFTAQLQPPPLQEMPLGLTNYWFFDKNGRPVAWNGQANGQPDYYANMYPTDAAHNWHVAGCIQDWTKIYHGQGSVTTAVSFWWHGEQRELACYDNFGDADYRRPFYHPGYGTWIIPVDVLTDEPVYGLVWGWGTAVVQIGDFQ